MLAVAGLLALLATPISAREHRGGGKLTLTDGVTSVEGAAGGGLATWAVIAGRETNAGVGVTAHVTRVVLPDFDLASFGAAVGLFDRVELSWTHQRFDTRAAGVALRLGQNFTFGQEVIGAKLRITGDAVWDQDRFLPQVAIGVQHKIATKGTVIRAVGGRRRSGTDIYVAATKMLLSHSLVLDGTVRWTKANQFGLLGFGGDRNPGASVQVEGSAGLLVSSRLLLGGEFRSKPDNLRFAHENDTYDVFAVWALHRNIRLTAAYTDLGHIATLRRQRGVFLSIQGGL